MPNTSAARPEASEESPVTVSVLTVVGAVSVVGPERLAL